VAEAEILERITFVSQRQDEHSERLKRLERMLQEELKLLRQLLKIEEPTFPLATGATMTQVIRGQSGRTVRLG
jgi:hypothetical protein